MTKVSERLKEHEEKHKQLHKQDEDVRELLAKTDGKFEAKHSLLDEALVGIRVFQNKVDERHLATLKSMEDHRQIAVEGLGNLDEKMRRQLG